MTVAEIIEKGGLAMWPLLFLSILSGYAIIDRVWFWLRVFLQERQIVNSVLEAAYRNWGVAAEITRDYKHHPLGRFFHVLLQLSHPEPEVFHLAMESAADDELALMRRGDKILEAVIALAPLLGLLGTVLGLIKSLGSITISDLGTSSTAGVPLGISESLISTAFGLVVAIVSLAFYRLFQAFLFGQVRVFRKAGADLEMIYRQQWLDRPPSSYPVTPPETLLKKSQPEASPDPSPKVEEYSDRETSPPRE